MREWINYFSGPGTYMHDRRRPPFSTVTETRRKDPGRPEWDIRITKTALVVHQPHPIRQTVIAMQGPFEFKVSTANREVREPSCVCSKGMLMVK